jgi:hypothetical protein
MSRASQTYHRTEDRPSYRISMAFLLHTLGGRKAPSRLLLSSYMGLKLARLDRWQDVGIVQPCEAFGVSV